MPMRCLYCDELYIKNSSIIHYLLKDDLLCSKCRKSLSFKPIKIKIKDIEVESFYVYDEKFRDMIVGYKESLDEALAPIFLYKIKEYINLRYKNYLLVYVPSSNAKIKFRGFDHMEKICEEIKLKKAKLLYKKEEISSNNLRDRSVMVDNIKLKEKCHLDKVLIIDDVLTSGSSMLGAYLALKPYARKIKCLTIAYSSRYMKSL